MKIVCLCHTCARQHVMDFDPRLGPGAGFSDWIVKHGEGHDTDFAFPQRSGKDHPVGHSWMRYLHNADVKTSYAASAAVTITMASLAASSTLLAGRSSAAITNASNKYLDFILAGHFKTAGSNGQAGFINVAVVGVEDDTPTWQDVFDGTDSTKTVSLQNVYDQICKIVAQISTTATNALTWPFGATSVAAQFGGNMPVQFLVFLAHSAETSANVWSATETDHKIRQTPVYLTVT